MLSPKNTQLVAPEHRGGVFLPPPKKRCPINGCWQYIGLLGGGASQGILLSSMVVEMVPLKGGLGGIESPNWQDKYHL